MSQRAKERTGNKNSQYGTYWITDGTINKKWSDKLGDMPEHFHRGRVINK